ncbi:MAG: hypothetical protein FVQ77_12160 [Cytophagales bacterium]|nr:hypothetical protein [Cytophagales bacterium]
MEKYINLGEKIEVIELNDGYYDNGAGDIEINYGAGLFVKEDMNAIYYFRMEKNYPYHNRCYKIIERRPYSEYVRILAICNKSYTMIEKNVWKGKEVCNISYYESYSFEVKVEIIDTPPKDGYFLLVRRIVGERYIER